MIPLSINHLEKKVVIIVMIKKLIMEIQTQAGQMIQITENTQPHYNDEIFTLR